ncbi:Rhamnogalacturonan acetylesterase [Cytospora mali]|uniref:Rhamnogalacturonan acetylesterase n=1 Tax=Cytospora mali TaxID=578113 RepID=A0A194VCV1_CYTMA|nr:Rhamnogalacturonan acetylesterase [Valsa mali var. pyri (nom. inval.)]
MAPGGGHNGTEGWGQYLQYSLDASKMTVNNSAYAGRSARTFTREGRFQNIFDKVQLGDWAIIEFGHNDGPADPANDTKNRVDCPGISSETCPVTYNNQTEIVQTYVTYLRNASSIFLSLGAKVIISSQTPTNPYDNSNGTYSWVPTIYEWYSWYIVDSLGGPSKGIYYVNHGDYGAQALRLMGKETANFNFPMDHTHTSPWLADVFSKAFVLGVKCGTSPFQDFVVNATSRIEGDQLGTCAMVNSTLPIKERAIEAISV